jgi:hypothetical protein
MSRKASQADIDRLNELVAEGRINSYSIETGLDGDDVALISPVLPAQHIIFNISVVEHLK